MASSDQLLRELLFRLARMVNPPNPKMSQISWDNTNWVRVYRMPNNSRYYFHFCNNTIPWWTDSGTQEYIDDMFLWSIGDVFGVDTSWRHIEEITMDLKSIRIVLSGTNGQKLTIEQK